MNEPSVSYEATAADEGASMYPTLAKWPVLEVLWKAESS